jgi:transcriptional regulator with XRE-family HTH domain
MVSTYSQAMSTFGETLKKRRQALHLTREEFATRAGISVNYLISIEARGNRTPHRKKLFDIIRVAACKSPQQAKNASAAHGIPLWKEVDGTVVAELLTALDDLEHIELDKDLRLHRHPSFEDELQEQYEEQEASEVWIISDLLAEASNDEAATKTAHNMLRKKMTYRFFVPFSSPELHWKTAVDQLAAALPESHKDDVLSERVRVYRLSECAFSCRLRISLPGSEAPRGRYSTGGTSGDAIDLVPAPHDVIARITANLGMLCKRADAGWLATDPVVGVIERVYPPLVSAREKSMEAKQKKATARKL